MSSPDSAMQRIYRVAVASDIHAHNFGMEQTSGQTIPSWVSQKTSSPSIRRNPLSDLTTFVDSEGLSADLLLCPGDIADKGEESSLTYGWSGLQDVARALNASTTIGAVGNHDLHSRSSAKPEDGVIGIVAGSPFPNAKIRDLIPTYPVDKSDEFRRYWSDQIGCYQDGYCRVITLNSCASHGYIFEGTQEYERGRFSEEAETALRAALECSEPRPVNILLTHHHPQQVTELQFSDTSTMLRGDRLLNMLGSGKYGSWIVVHGHRHVPFFQLGPGDNDRPYVFSAGSVGVILHPLYYPLRPPNQFYVLEFDLNEIARRGTGLFGFVNAWNWHLGKGWHEASDDDSIPARSGFGSRTPAVEVARQVAEFMRAQSALEVRPGPFGVFEENLSQQCPDVAFLLPSDREKFKAALQSQGIAVSRHPRQRGRMLFVYTAGEAEVDGAVS